MLVIPGRAGKTPATASRAANCCASAARPSSASAWPTCFGLQKATAKEATDGGPGFGKAKSVILLYLQGGPSHLDLWDPKDNVPDNVNSVFKPIGTKLPGVQFTELLPKLAQVNDKVTLIRSMSYTPVGLFNHTAAIYQMLTGYTADKVSPSGQLEPPSPKDFPNVGSQHHPAQAADRADAAVRHAAPAAAGEQRRRQGRHGRLPRPGLRPLHALPARRRHGHEQDGRASRSTTCSSARRCRRCGWSAAAKLRDLINEGMPDLEKATDEVRPRRILRQGPRPGHLRPGAQRLRPRQGAEGDARDATA